MKEASPAPSPQEDPGSGREHPARLPGEDAWAEGAEAHQAPSQAPLVPEVRAECPPEDLDYGDSVEAGHVFEDFSSEGVLSQLDDMSSPPSPESTDSSPERGALPCLTLPTPSQQLVASPAEAELRREVPPVCSEDAVHPPPWAEGPQGKVSFQQDQAKAVMPGPLGGQAAGRALVGQEEGPSQTAVLRAKAPVKRVTWNLQGAAGSALAEDRGLREWGAPAACRVGWVVCSCGMERPPWEPPPWAAHWVTPALQALVREASVAQPMVLVAGMLLWNFPAGK